MAGSIARPRAVRAKSRLLRTLIPDILPRCSTRRPPGGGPHARRRSRHQDQAPRSRADAGEAAGNGPPVDGQRERSIKCAVHWLGSFIRFTAGHSGRTSRSPCAPPSGLRPACPLPRSPGRAVRSTPAPCAVVAAVPRPGGLRPFGGHQFPDSSRTPRGRARTFEHSHGHRMTPCTIPAAGRAGGMRFREHPRAIEFTQRR